MYKVIDLEDSLKYCLNTDELDVLFIGTYEECVKFIVDRETDDTFYHVIPLNNERE